MGGLAAEEGRQRHSDVRSVISDSTTASTHQTTRTSGPAPVPPPRWQAAWQAANGLPAAQPMNLCRQLPGDQCLRAMLGLPFIGRPMHNTNPSPTLRPAVSSTTQLLGKCGPVLHLKPSSKAEVRVNQSAGPLMGTAGTPSSAEESSSD